jgi:hypothetical protein
MHGDFKFSLGIGFLLLACPISQPRQMGKDFHSIYGNIHMVHIHLPSICGTVESQHSSASSTCNMHTPSFMP